MSKRFTYIVALLGIFISSTLSAQPGDGSRAITALRNASRQLQSALVSEDPLARRKSEQLFQNAQKMARIEIRRAIGLRRLVLQSRLNNARFDFMRYDSIVQDFQKSPLPRSMLRRRGAQAEIVGEYLSGAIAALVLNAESAQAKTLLALSVKSSASTVIKKRVTQALERALRAANILE
jgi:hypothetical protein